MDLPHKLTSLFTNNHAASSCKFIKFSLTYFKYQRMLRLMSEFLSHGDPADEAFEVTYQRALLSDKPIRVDEFEQMYGGDRFDQVPYLVDYTILGIVMQELVAASAPTFMVEDCKINRQQIEEVNRGLRKDPHREASARLRRQHILQKVNRLLCVYDDPNDPTKPSGIGETVQKQRELLFQLSQRPDVSAEEIGEANTRLAGLYNFSPSTFEALGEIGGLCDEDRAARFDIDEFRELKRRLRVHHEFHASIDPATPPHCLQ